MRKGISLQALDFHAWSFQTGNVCHLFIETIHPSCDWEENSNLKLSSVRAEYSWRSSHHHQICL